MPLNYPSHLFSSRSLSSSHLPPDPDRCEPRRQMDDDGGDGRCSVAHATAESGRAAAGRTTAARGGGDDDGDAPWDAFNTFLSFFSFFFQI